MSIIGIKRTSKCSHVFRQFVFIGRAPHGEHRELVATDRHEIDTIAAIEELSGILTYHNVKVWPKGRYQGGHFVEGNMREDEVIAE